MFGLGCITSSSICLLYNTNLYNLCYEIGAELTSTTTLVPDLHHTLSAALSSVSRKSLAIFRDQEPNVQPIRDG